MCHKKSDQHPPTLLTCVLYQYVYYTEYAVASYHFVYMLNILSIHTNNYLYILFNLINTDDV